MASLVVKFLIGGVAAVAVGNILGSRITVPPSGQTPPAPAEAKAASPPEPSEQEAPVETDKTEDQKIADGTHCVDGWDDSFPPLKAAVKEELRNPRSFEHVRTVWTPVGKGGKFGLIMTYRAQNGFGGMNVENIGALVDAKTCQFRIASALMLAKRLHD